MPSGSSSYRGQGAVQAFKAVLKNVDSTRSVDITNLILDVAIYEDIFSKTMYGTCAIEDAVNVMNGEPQLKQGRKSFPIVGEEYIEFAFTVAGFPERSFRFMVNSITSVSIDKAFKTRKYVINFASEEHLLDAVTTLRKSYQDQISVMVEDILKNYLHVDAEEKNGKRKKTYEIQPTKGKQNLIIPALTPFEALDFLAKRSVAEEAFKSATFHFFENKNGFNFCDIEYMIRRGKLKIQNNLKARTDKGTAEKDPSPYEYYIRPQTLLNPTRNNSDHEVADDSKTFKTFISFEQKHKFDTIEKIKRGYFESEMYYYDVINRELKTNRFRFLDKYQELNALGDSASLGESTYPENSIDFIKSVTSEDKKNSLTKTIMGIFGLIKNKPDQSRASKTFLIPYDSTQPPTYLEETIPQRASYMTRFAQNMFTAEIYGDPRLTASDVITVDLPEIRGDTTGKVKDKYLSGYFMITAIKHKLTQETYSMTIDLFKNGFSQAVDSTDSEDKLEPANSTYLNQAEVLGVKS